MGLRPGKATNDPNAYVAVGFQSAKGTEASTFTFSRYGAGSGINIERDVQREREGGDGQQVGFSYVSMIKADAALTGRARPNHALHCLFGVLGADSVGSAAVASLARHTLTPVASLPYATVDERYADTIHRSVDNVFTSVTIEGEAGRPWNVSAQLLGGGTVYQRDIASTLTPVREVGKPFMYPQGSYIFDGGASYAADFTKIKVEITRGVDDGIQTTELTRDDVITLSEDSNVEGTLKYTSRALWQKVQFGGGSIVPADLATGSVDLTQLQQIAVTGSQFATGAMRIRLPLIEWTDVKVNKNEPDGKTMYLDVVGMSVKGATHSVIAEIDSAVIADLG